MISMKFTFGGRAAKEIKIFHIKLLIDFNFCREETNLILQGINQYVFGLALANTLKLLDSQIINF
jgi:hypothetical protein